MTTHQEDRLDELLEAIWIAREEGGKNAREVVSRRTAIQGKDEDFETLVEKGFLESSDDDGVKLTRKGEYAAANIIRRHRLAEVLLSTVLDLDESRVESAACNFEHHLNPEVIDSICTLLGHPASCPHGKPIPRAKCCEKFKKDLQPISSRLSELRVGQKGKITMIAPRFHSRLDRLGGLGIVPGIEVKLHQKMPSIVIETGETTIALDTEIAQEIYVRPAN